jgi:hypothetical protein
LCPRGEWRADARALFLAQAALAPYQKGGGKLDPKDYFPHLYRVRDMTDAELREAAEALCMAWGGTFE